MDEEVIQHCLLRPNMEVLSLPTDTLLSWETAESLHLSNPTCAIFPRIRPLEVTADSKALQLILPGLTHLQSIILRIRHDSAQSQTNILACLSFFTA